MQRRDFLLKTGKSALISAISLQTVTGATHHLPNSSVYQKNIEQLDAELEKLLPKLMKDNHVPGLSIAIVRDGKLNWNKGFGVKDQQSQEPVNIETVFEAASVSKTVFAYAVMKLCEKGTIGLDVPLVNYSKKRFLESDPRLDKITARHVLSHTSGFQNMRSSAEPLRINFNPGTNFLYSGEGYYYLQSVITELTGTVNPNECGSYENDLSVCATDIGDFLTQNVLVPNGMNRSAYIWTDSIGKNAALPHNIEGKLFSKPHQTAVDMARYASVGGLLTSAKDYANFMIGLFTPKENDPSLLNKSSIEEMVRPQVKLPDDQKIDGASSWALGWAIQERPAGNIILHSGGQSGFKSLTMASLEKKSGFVILTNSDKGGYVLYNEDVMNILNRLFA